MELDNLTDLITHCKNIGSRRIYLIGAGAVGEAVAKILDENHIEWKCFVDKMKTGTYCGKPIITYSECDDKDGFYIISSIRYKEDVIKNVQKIIGISDESHIITLSDFVRQYLNPPLSGMEALEYLLGHCDFNTVLDIGCGEGLHSEMFLNNGKNVTALDYGSSWHFRKWQGSNKIKLVITNINTYESNEVYDLVWCCHVLEHQLNPHDFLRKLYFLTKENGFLAITVPPYETEYFIQGGHVSWWNAGLLLYHLVLAGFDCREAHVKQYGYNISVVVQKHSINILDQLEYDRGDIRKIKRYLPQDIEFVNAGDDDHFDGSIKCLNWL